MTKYRLTSHGKARANQRMQVSSKRNASSAFSSAMMYGLSPADFDGSFRNFLVSKTKRGSKVKVHDGMIFIYKGRTMITCYKVPHKYIHCVLDRKQEKHYFMKWKDAKNKELQTQLIKRVRTLAYYVFNARRCKVVASKESFDIFYSYLLQTELIIKVIFKHLFGGDLYPSKLIMTEDLVQVLFKYNEKFRECSQVTPGFGKRCKPEDKESDLKNQKEMQHILIVLISCLNYIRVDDYFIDVYKGSDNNVKRFKNTKVIE